MALFLWPQYCRTEPNFNFTFLIHNTIWYILGWLSLVKFKVKVKVKVEVNMFLCLIKHWHINVRSEKCIIVAIFAVLYMNGVSNKEVKVYFHRFVKVFHIKYCFTYYSECIRSKS